MKFLKILDTVYLETGTFSAGSRVRRCIWATYTRCGI